MKLNKTKQKLYLDGKVGLINDNNDVEQLREVTNDRDYMGSFTYYHKNRTYPNSQIQSDFTGKLDDNRKEIYECDIVVDIIGKHYSVEWNDDTCKYQLSDGSDLNDNDRYGTYLVVIGNIYENKNLIN